MPTRYPTVKSLFEQAVEIHRKGDLQKASDLYAQILQAKPGFTPAINNIALIARDMGRLDLAYNMLRESLRHDAHNVETLANTGLVALQLRDFAGAENYLRHLLHHKPDQFDARLKLGLALYGQNKFDDAANVFRALLKHQPANFDLLYNLGVVGVRLGDVQSALDYFQRALDVRPGDIGTLNQMAEQWLLQKDLIKAAEYLDRSLAAPVMNNRALSLKSVLFNLGGDAAALENLYRYDQLLMISQVQPGESFGNTEEFNRRLIECLDQQVTMERDPAGQATVNGLHSRTITHLQDPVMIEMNRLIGAAFEKAAQSASTVNDHPYPAWLPRRQILDSWTIRLRAGGFQRAHIHPRAWLSGCYYVKVPAAVHDSRDQHAGWIGFGSPDEKYGVKESLCTRLHEPQAGDIVTFPSYFWHHTVPFSGDEERISLAFDICPA